MKKPLIFSLFTLLILLGTYCDLPFTSKQQKVVNGQCGACHQVPDPSTLTTKIWKESVLPQMSLYYYWQGDSEYNYANQIFKKKNRLPMNDETWKLIEDYYIENSPLEIPIRATKERAIQNKFEEIVIDDICSFPSVTALTVEQNGEVLCSCDGQLFTLDTNFEPTRLLTSNSIISQAKRKSANELYVLSTGRLDPHNQPIGDLGIFNSDKRTKKMLRDSLFRPTFMNTSKAGDIVVSEYGHDVGRLSIINATTKQKNNISQLPGAYRSYWIDTNKDGEEELLVQFSQAKEGVYRFMKDGKGKYQSEEVLTFQPQFGFSDLDTADINGDGFVDLVITNGDNADYSMILKNYHGVRVYLNDTNGNFEESYFYPLYGATQVRCLDATGNGRSDIVVATFFPNEVSESLLLLTNESTEQEVIFSDSRFEHANKGRWMVMQDGDIDGDGDMDILVGSFLNGPSSLEQTTVANWISKSVDLLVLKNLSK